MKKAICIILSLCLLLSAVPFAIAASNVSVTDGWSVLVPEQPTDYESYAAEKISGCLSEIFSAEINVVTQAENNYIAIGRASEADVSSLKDNSYRIKAIGGNVHINGTGVRGLQAGACRFLEEFFGRKVYTASITVMPKADWVTVPGNTDIVYEAFFEYSDTDWKSPRDWEYSLANGITGGTYRRLPYEMGGTVNYLGGFCHTMGALCESEKYAETHPEYLALHDGKRTTDQPCLTNPDVLEIAKNNVLSMLASGHDPEASVQIVSVTQNDNYNYCECENCKAYEKAHGDVRSATMISFVNRIADAVKAAGYDNVAIDTFAYQYTRQAPTGIAPRDNVIVRLCTIECCFAHTLDDPSCERNAALMKDLSDWSKICSRIYVWDYTTNYRNTCMVFPDFGVIQRNIQVFYENNVKGVYEEGNYYIDACDTEFGELRAYMIAKSLQNPYCDLDSEVNGFLEAYYGPGWKSIKKILGIFTENAGTEDGHLEIYYGPEQSLQLSDRQIREIDDLWKNALSQAETKEQRDNVIRSKISWRFWKAGMNKGEYSLLNPARYNEKEQLFRDLKAHGVSTISEGGYGDYLDCICIRYAPPNEWDMYEADETGAQTRLFFGKILERFTPLLAMFGLYYEVFRCFSFVYYYYGC
ncbi:MAG: DUF4838 domain-containing protein [Clostridia bacterium]|nr:DUF4838 domain-containing protein [Clostridia bacterium]